MNIVEIIAFGTRLYRQNVGLYTIAGAVFFLTSIISAGLFVFAFIIDCLLALFLGPNGTWIKDPALAALIWGIMVAGGAAGTFLLFSSMGAFMHLCARIGAGDREINLIEYFEYIRDFGFHFWLIGLAQQFLGFAAAIPILYVGLVLSETTPHMLLLGLIGAVFAYRLAQIPFWLAYPAQVIQKKGFLYSLFTSVRTSFQSPMGSIIAIFLLTFFEAVPLMLNAFYPVYMFFIFAPFSAVMVLAYYEAAKGMLG